MADFDGDNLPNTVGMGQSDFAGGEFDGDQLPNTVNVQGALTGGSILFVTFAMKGKDSLGNPVYWSSSDIDTDASDYSGGNTPITDIVVVKRFSEISSE